MLIQASASSHPHPHTPHPHPHPHPPPATSIDEYTAAYYGDYSNMPLNDGFDSNLQIMVDGGARWTAIDATTAIYSPYGTGP
jgi:hypothetical protein